MGINNCHFENFFGAELWSSALLLEGGGRLLGLRQTAAAVVVYTRSQAGDQAWVFVRRSGELFARVPLH